MAKKQTQKKSSAGSKKTSAKSVKTKNTVSAASKKKTLDKKATTKTSKKATLKRSVASKKSNAETKTKKKIPKTTEQKKMTSDNKVEVMSPTKKIRKIQGYSKAELEEFKQIIIQKRNEIIEQLQALKEQMMDPSTGQYVNENSPYSLHMAEQGTDAMEREKLYLWAQRENKFLGYLDEALQRIENGTYGICIECIDEPQHLCPTCPLIPKERLKAVPHTQHCLQVKQKMQSK
ncbi:TraR/DksA family transcriptional regulator [Melioribacter sp. OK-6-Me]|uniref:TraR/DksA family transcriptional regulator n=1 Tax=unclassified Melioribacter TaxID=2627329 RepID=UPI003ED90EDD